MTLRPRIAPPCRGRRNGVLSTLLTVVLAACSVAEEGVPAGKVAVVGDVVLGPEDLAGVQAQLGAYAQLRFSGREGRMALVQGVVTAELLAQKAVANGLGDDPRVVFALEEELATLYLAAELERRVPRALVAADTAALRAYYRAHPDEFTVPEKRNIEGVFYRSADEAERVLAQLTAGELTLKQAGEIVSTPLQTRDDVAHPGFHALLFDATLTPGQWLAHPVLAANVLIAGRVQQLIPATVEAFDEPGVQERLVQAVRAPLLEVARADLLAELAGRFPAQPVDDAG